MKSIISTTMTLVAFAATLLSFTNFGGEGFEIFLNNKVVIQQFGKTTNAVNSLRLNQQSSNDQLTVKYYHCGQVGKNRVITIKDGQNKVLKEWRYADAAASISSSVAMNCNVKDILNLNRGKERTLNLYYSSNELPNGRLLANIVVENNPVASSK
ncbi:MAG: hypothetical protein H7Z13_02835 [Ferruginibacter sp.]|nr:hypothetical protein [Ferruginibacter sp.]